MNTVYKICRSKEWAQAEAEGVFRGNGDDARDGLIHLSAIDQVAGTFERHFRGDHDLVLVAIDAAALGKALRWERSLRGELYPHLYGPLPLQAVQAVEALPQAFESLFGRPKSDDTR